MRGFSKHYISSSQATLSFSSRILQSNCMTTPPHLWLVSRASDFTRADWRIRQEGFLLRFIKCFYISSLVSRSARVHRVIEIKVRVSHICYSLVYILDRYIFYVRLWAVSEKHQRWQASAPLRRLVILIIIIVSYIV